MINLCTLTGVDVRTDLSRVIDLAAAHPFLEFGVLLSRTPEDKDARYPTFAEIERIVDGLTGKANLALHVCGRAVKEFVSGADDIDALIDAGIGRVQLNFPLPKMPFNVDELDAAISRTRAAVITQHFPANSILAEVIKAENHHVLFDASGGRGIAAADFARPFEGKYTGYAGGMGPENIEAAAAAVVAASGDTPVWIDMENRIRTDGYLDLSKCETVADIAARFVTAA